MRANRARPCQEKTRAHSRGSSFSSSSFLPLPLLMQQRAKTLLLCSVGRGKENTTVSFFPFPLADSSLPLPHNVQRARPSVARLFVGVCESAEDRLLLSLRFFFSVLFPSSRVHYSPSLDRAPNRTCTRRLSQMCALFSLLFFSCDIPVMMRGRGLRQWVCVCGHACMGDKIDGVNANRVG